MNFWQSFDQTSRWALLLLLLLPLLAWRMRRSRPRGIRFSALWMSPPASATWRVRLYRLLPVLRLAALALLILALARPRQGNEQTRIPTEGIAIQLVVDRSGSMQAHDFQIDGKRVDRLTAVRSVVRDFVVGSGNLRGRPDDLIGMITFARYADDRCPLTLDHGYLLEQLEFTQLARTQQEDGTAIGDGLALAVERLRALEEQQRLAGKSKIKSRIAILLTDGENNAGELEPLQAAELAATYGIKVYTIGAGTHGVAPVPVYDPFSGRQVMQPMQVSIDEDTLRAIAKTTGGEYFRATDTDSLRSIYAQIDQLEKTRTSEVRYFQFRDWATASIRLGRLTLPPLLVCVIGLLAIELALRRTWLRRLP